jgi:hypothetical protein
MFNCAFTERTVVTTAATKKIIFLIFINLNCFCLIQAIPAVSQGFYSMVNNVASNTQGQPAGDFLSSRKAARAETTGAALDG